MQPIPLGSLLPADFDPAKCKLHCAVFNGENYPIDVLANDPAEWQRWNSWRGDKNDFNRQFIFSLAQDRHDPTLWLFGGIWAVVARRPEPRTYSYDVVARRPDGPLRPPPLRQVAPGRTSAASDHGFVPS